MRLVASAAALGLLISLPALAQTPAAAEVPPPAAQAPSAAPAVQAPPVSAPAVIPVAEPMAPAPAVPVAAPAAPAAAAPPAWNTVLREELLVDSYYMYNFSGANSLVPPTGRNYDQMSNSFTMNYAKVGLQLDSDPVMVRADIGFGPLAGYLGGGSNPYASAIQQAFASIKVPGTALTVDFGRFNTTAGAEVIEANRNWLYSRSMLFYVIPVHHTGLRLNYKVSDMLSLQATVANGTFNDMPDNNSFKTMGGSVTVTPMSTTSITGTAYFSKEGPQGDAGPVRSTADLVVAHNVSDVLGLNLNADYVKLGEANLFGVSAMGHFVMNEHLNLSLRGEFIKDKGIYLSPDASIYEGTLGLAVPFAGHFEVRAELRGDFASEEVFVTDRDAEGDPLEAKKNQFTGTIAFLGYIQ